MRNTLIFRVSACLIAIAVISACGEKKKNSTESTNKSPATADAKKNSVSDTATVSTFSSTTKTAYADAFLADAFEKDDAAYTDAQSLALDSVPSVTDSTQPDEMADAELHTLIHNTLLDIADVDHNKIISRDEFKNFRVSGVDLTADAKARTENWRNKVFDKADSNKDNQLNEDELDVALNFVASRVHLMRHRLGIDVHKNAKQYWSVALARFDVNNDGKLDSDERKKMLESVKADIQEAQEKLKIDCAIDANKNTDRCRAYKAMIEFCASKPDQALAQDLCRRYVGN